MSISAELGEALIPVRLVMDQLNKDLKETRGKVDGALKGMVQRTQKAGKALAAGLAGGIAIAGAAIIGIANQAIPAASNLNEALNATRVVFGDAADEIHAFGETAADVAGLSAAEFNQMGAQTGAMLKNYGLGADEAASATIDLAKRAADMASIFDTDVGDAMGAINAAMRGEADPIERYGVAMSAAAVDAKALEMGLADATGELSNQAKTQARLALLFEQTDAIAGDFVNTSGDLANATRVQSARWENFMARIGSFALPILSTFQALFLDIGERVFPIIINALSPIAEIFQAVGEAVASFIGVLVEGVEPIDAVKQLIYDIGVALGLGAVEAALLGIEFQNIVARAQEMWAVLMEFLTPIWEAIAGFVSFQDVLIALGGLVLSFVIPTVASLVMSMLPIIATIAAVVGAVAILRNAWESDFGGIRTNLTAWWEETGKPIFDLLRIWLQENIPLAIQTLTNFWTNTLQPAMLAVWAWMSGTLIPFLTGTVFPWLREKIPAAIQTLSDFWTNTLQPAIQSVWSWLSTVLIPFFADTVFPWLQEKIPAAIQTLSDFWTETLKPAIDLVWAFLSEDVIPLFESLWELFNVAGTIALEALAGIWQNVLLPALTDVWSFIQNSILPIFDSVATTIKNDLQPPLEFLANTVLAGLTTAFEGIKQAITAVKSAVSGLIAKLKQLELPAVFTPGSPTPFEMGLRGINKALGSFNKLLDSNALINGPSLSLNPLNEFAAAGMDMEFENRPNVSYNSETVINTNRDPLPVLRASRHLDKLGGLK